jgi:two-component system sensor histidine kinase UhpB
MNPPRRNTGRRQLENEHLRPSGTGGSGRTAASLLIPDEHAPGDLTIRLIDAHDAARARLACTLHDDVCQRMAVIGIGIHMLRQSPPPALDVLRASLDILYGEVQRLTKDLGRISRDLNPASLEHQDLASAIAALCASLSQPSGLAIPCRTSDVPRTLPGTVARCMYNVSQEALQNAIRHSSAVTVQVDLEGGGGQLRLVVQDDGCGFDAEAPQSRQGLGLELMRERVRALRGRLIITSAPGEGTRVEAAVPVATPVGVAGEARDRD